LPVAHIEFHHFLNHDAEMLRSLFDLGAPVEVIIHDYSWICPRITLVGATGRYCGEPFLEACARCLADVGGLLDETISVFDLRARSYDWLYYADRVIVPSENVKGRLARYFPGIDFTVRSWEMPEPFPAATANARLALAEKERVLKVGVIGAIGDVKGYRVLQDCALDAKDRELPLDFVLIGFSQDDSGLLDTGRVFVTGRYDEDELPGLLAREDCDVILLPAVWPETWSYVLTQALSAGFPVAAFDIGAIAERLRRESWPCLLLPLATKAQQINDRLLAWTKKAPPVETSPPSDVPALLHCASRDTFLSSSPEAGFPMNSSQNAPSALIASAEILSLQQGLYLVSINAATPTAVGAKRRLQAPAAHVGLGPGHGAGQVEFLSHTRHGDQWLCYPEDRVVVRVIDGEADVLVTTLQVDVSAQLYVSVQRLGGGASQTSAQVSALPGALQAPQGGKGLKFQITAHVCRRGDLVFLDPIWAGCVGEALPIEAFDIVPRQILRPDQIEYRGVLLDGSETPWMDGGGLCGSRGKATSLTGFAVRLKGDAAQSFDCVYTGAFVSGQRVGPLSNGMACLSPISDDPLEAIQLAIYQRDEVAQTEHAILAGDPPDVEIGAETGGKRLFSIFRETDES
jgi:glycosyltransferase involved in cell wall biosynthesis